MDLYIYRNYILLLILIDNQDQNWFYWKVLSGSIIALEGEKQHKKYSKILKILQWTVESFKKYLN